MRTNRKKLHSFVMEIKVNETSSVFFQNISALKRYPNVHTHYIGGNPLHELIGFQSLSV